MQFNETKTMTHDQKVALLAERIKRLRKSLPEAMWSAMERRVCAQTNVNVATDALLKLQEEAGQ